MRYSNISGCGQRISVVGTSGSGKTTLARQISKCLAIPHVELDALNWNPNWTPASTGLLRDRTAQALGGNSWVVDGNYSKVRDIVWGLADTVVWLDYSLPVILSRSLQRTLRRVVTQEELWNGNRETWRMVFSSESIVLWVLRTYKKKRKEYPLLFKKSEYAHLKIVHLRSPQITHIWLSSLTA